jgi:hypothetical protein
VDEVIDERKKTLIFCDSLELGESLAKRHSIPFISGGTAGNERLDMIRNNEKIVISRVGDLGVSVADLKRVIEFDFLYGSRSQELQRLGRLFHSEYKGEHVVLMTTDEYVRHKKRLFGVYEKGFEIDVVRGEGVPTNLSDLALSTPSDVVSSGRARTQRIIETKLPVPKPVVAKPEFDPSKFPLLDERRKLDRDLIKAILGSPFCVEQKGIPIKAIRAVLNHNHIKYTNYNQVMHLVNSMFESFEIGGRTRGKDRIYFLQEAAQ